MKFKLGDQRGSVLIETVFVLAGSLLPVLLTATALAAVLDSQNKLELINREAGRAFTLAATNAAGASELSSLQEHHRLAGFPIKLQLRCFQDCLAGTKFELRASVLTTIFEVPYLPDLNLTLNTSLIATIDRFVER